MSYIPAASKSSASALDTDLNNLSDWQRRHLPGIHSSPGKEGLAWLIANWGQPKSFKDLLASTQASEMAAKNFLNQFFALGLVEMNKDPANKHRREILATMELGKRLEQYAGLITRVVASHEGRRIG